MYKSDLMQPAVRFQNRDLTMEIFVKSFCTILHDIQCTEKVEMDLKQYSSSVF